MDWVDCCVLPPTIPFSSTVKQWTLWKADNLSTADGSLAPDWFYYRTNTFRTCKKQTPLNSEQRTLMRPRRTLSITNYLQKRTVKLHPPTVLYIMQMLVDRFCKTVCHPSLDSKIGHYNSTVAHHASLSHHGTAMDDLIICVQQARARITVEFLTIRTK